jgi:hypothetical protein
MELDIRMHRPIAVSRESEFCERTIGGEPHLRELKPERCVAEAAGGAPRRGLKLVLRRFGLRQAQEYENGAVEGPHLFGGQ